MKIHVTYPPNYDEIATRFNIANKHTLVFTYGEVIHNPYVCELSEDVIIHEKVHMKQQGNDPAGWWSQYLSDDKFRYEQELEAYRTQWNFIKDIYNRDGRRQILKNITKAFSSDIYGNLCTQPEAEKAITL